jgi:ribosomal protein L40E
MARFPEAEARLIKNKFVCRKCKTAIKAPNMLVIGGFVKCRKCKSRALRAVKKK